MGDVLSSPFIFSWHDLSTGQSYLAFEELGAGLSLLPQQLLIDVEGKRFHVNYKFKLLTGVNEP